MQLLQKVDVSQSGWGSTELWYVNISQNRHGIYSNLHNLAKYQVWHGLWMQFNNKYNSRKQQWQYDLSENHTNI